MIPAFLAALSLAACNKEKPAAAPPRFAVVRFENLTGDSSLEWTGRAASEVLAVTLESGLGGPVLRANAVSRFAQSLGAHSAAVPGVSGERPAALLAGANHIITGYVELENGRFRVTASEENASTGKNVRTVSATESSFDAALGRLASQFTSKAKPYLTANPDAVRNYAAALEETAADGARDFRKALDADPDFGPAWVSRAALDAGRGDRAAFTQTVTEARRRKIDPFSSAQLDLEEAAVDGNNKARVAALRKVTDMSPGDTSLLRSLAEVETSIGAFQASAADWARLTAQAPAEFGGWNNLAYARAFAGDYAGALAALQEYARLRPNDANPLDSLGDVHYDFGKFAEAAAAYAKATQKDPNFERQGDLYKAAWAKFRAGDKAGADKLMAEFQSARNKQPDPVTPLLAADWLYRTGRGPQAIALLRQAAAPAPPDTGKADAGQAAQTSQLRMNALSQLAVWELLAGDRAKAAMDVAAMGKPGNLPALIAAFAAMPSAAAGEWETRAGRLFPAPQMQSLRRAALAYALLLDGKREAALPIWKQVAAAAPGDFHAAAVVARLEGRKPALEVAPNPAGVNQFLAVLDQLAK